MELGCLPVRSGPAGTTVSLTTKEEPLLLQLAPSSPCEQPGGTMEMVRTYMVDLSTSRLDKHRLDKLRVLEVDSEIQ